MKSQLATLAATALLAVTGAAHAQSTSQVTVFGLLDLSVGETKAPGGERDRGVDNGKMTTSHIGFRGSEDLGGGLAAVFRLETFLRADTGRSGRFDGDSFWSRNATVGLSDQRYGTLTLGRNTTPLFVSTLQFNPFGDSYGYSPAIRHIFTSGTVTGDSAWNGSILYSSPSFAGVRFGAAVTDSTGNGRNWGLNAGYSNGPIGASLVFQNVEKDNSATAAVDDTRTWQLAGSYDLQVAKLYAQFGKVDTKTTGNDYDIFGFGAAVPVGAGKVLAYGGRIKPDTGAKRTTFSLGYDHFLSKRTDVYVAAMSDKIDGLSRGHGYSIGMRHRF